jgi:hypothetical protein
MTPGSFATLPRIIRYITKPIETLRPGDYVLARDEHDADGEQVLRQVEEVFQRTAYRLHIITLRSSTGIVQTIQTTAEHPVYALQQGWVEAGKLQAGNTIAEPNGAISTITAVRTERHPQGIPVYNFRVQDAHTYFVRAEGSQAEPIWVHNACVYQAEADGEVRYVGIANRGITKTLAQRLRAATLRTGAPAEVIPGLADVSPEVAEAVEATLIQYHGRVSGEGTLLNTSRGTRFLSNSGDQLAERLELGTAWLRKVGYPGF